MQIQGWPNFLILKLLVKSHGTEVLTSVCSWDFITIEASVYIFVSFLLSPSAHSWGYSHSWKYLAHIPSREYGLSLEKGKRKHHKWNLVAWF